MSSSALSSLASSASSSAASYMSGPPWVNVSARQIDERRLLYSCVFCFSSYDREGNPRSSATPIDHLCLTGGNRRYRIIAVSVPPCEPGRFPHGLFSGFLVHVTSKTHGALAPDVADFIASSTSSSSSSASSSSSSSFSSTSSFSSASSCSSTSSSSSTPSSSTSSASSSSYASSLSLSGSALSPLKSLPKDPFPRDPSASPSSSSPHRAPKRQEWSHWKRMYQAAQFLYEIDDDLINTFMDLQSNLQAMAAWKLDRYLDSRQPDTDEDIVHRFRDRVADGGACTECLEVRSEFGGWPLLKAVYDMAHARIQARKKRARP